MGVKRLSGDLDNKEFMEFILKYRQLLSEGRVKPNSKAGEVSTVRESKENLDKIAQVDAKLAEIFRLDTNIVSNFN